MEEKTKEKWKKVIESEFISSKESANDEEGDYIIISSLYYGELTKFLVFFFFFFHQLDEKSVSNKNPQARRQCKCRVICSDPSDCPQPEANKFPAWSLTD